MTLIGYGRVSTDEQSLDLQREQLLAAGCARIFEERVSGKDADRPELQACLKFLAEGDKLIVTKLDRLARNTIDMLTIITGLAKRGVAFVSLAEPWANTDSPAAEMILTVIAAPATARCGAARSASSGLRAPPNSSIAVATAAFASVSDVPVTKEPPLKARNANGRCARGSACKPHMQHGGARF